MKITEIEFEDRKVRIIDSFTCIYQTQQTNQGRKNKNGKESSKVQNCSDKQSNLIECSKEQLQPIRKAKNVIKNIIRLFKNWLQGHTHEELELAIKMDDLIRSNKEFNKNLITKLSKDSLLRRAFIAFSEGPGEQMIGKSRILNKECHVQALRKYHK